MNDQTHKAEIEKLLGNKSGEYRISLADRKERILFLLGRGFINR